VIAAHVGDDGDAGPDQGNGVVEAARAGGAQLVDAEAVASTRAQMSGSSSSVLNTGMRRRIWLTTKSLIGSRMQAGISRHIGPSTSPGSSPITSPMTATIF